MREVLSRIHYALTGIRGDAIPPQTEQPWTMGAGTLADLHVVLGWDNMRGKIPESWFPLCVIEPVSAEETQRGSGQKLITYQINVTLGVLVPSRLGALFGRDGGTGIVDLEERLRAVLKADRQLRAGGTPYTRDLLTINSRSEVEIAGMIIRKRFATVALVYDRITF